MGGWIKLHRKLLENPLMRRPSWAWLWVVLLLKANHKETSMIWNGKLLVIKEGQFVTGRKELSEQSGLPESTVEDILKYLENQHQIQQQKETKYRLITIINWNEYQEPDTESNNKATTKQQQSDTNNNDKKDKKDSFSKEKHFGYEIVEPLNKEAEASSFKEKAKPENNRIRQYFRQECKKALGESPPDSVAAASIVARALKRLTEKQCKEKIDYWLTGTHSDQKLLSITACFSDNEVNGYLTGI